MIIGKYMLQMYFLKENLDIIMRSPDAMRALCMTLASRGAESGTELTQRNNECQR
jgi:hypothetical protein